MPSGKGRWRRIAWIGARLLFFECALDAAEPICPGGTSPRPDVFWCSDFSNLTHCQTGLEDQCRIDNASPLPLNASWFWDGSNGSLWFSKTVIGVIDYRGPAGATAPFTVYYDDLDIASASLWSCAGWNAASCPFGGVNPPPVDTMAPFAPKGLNVS